MTPPNTPRKDEAREPDLVKRLRTTRLLSQRNQMDLQVEAAAEIERLRTALESIADHNKVRDWTATSDNPETHWVTRDGYYAVIARQALKEHPRNAD